MKSPKDHLLLNVAAEVYKVCPDPDALLPYLIKDNPLLPVVYNYRIKINTKTEGQPHLYGLKHDRISRLFCVCSVCSADIICVHS